MNEPSNTPRYATLYRWVLSMAFLILLVWLAYGYWALSGRLKVVYRAGEALPARMERFAPKETDAITGRSADGVFRLVTQDPLSFDIKTARPFAKATVKVTYQNPYNQPEIRLGINQKNGANFYQTMAIKDPKLDQLPSYWSVVREGELILAQKDARMQAVALKLSKIIEDIAYLKDQTANLATALKSLDTNSTSAISAQQQITNNQNHVAALRKEQEALEKNSSGVTAQPTYSTIADFLAKLPDYNRIATLNYDLTKNLRLENYQSGTSTNVIDSALRGSHTISTYIKNETLEFNFTLQELNQVAGADDFSIEVWQGDKKIASTTVADDGNMSANGVVSSPKTTSVIIPGLSEGEYQVRVNIKNDEVLIRRIETRQKLVTFLDHLYLVDNSHYHDIIPSIAERPTIVYSEGGAFNFLAKSITGRQTVTVNDEPVLLKEAKTGYATKTRQWPAGLRQINIPINDVYLTSNGGLSFTAAQYFDPKMGIANTTDLDNIDQRDFVIANYPQADQVGDWLVASQTITEPFVYQNEQDRIRFVVSMPGLADNRRSVKIKEIEVLLERDPLTPAKIWNKIINLIKR